MSDNTATSATLDNLALDNPADYALDPAIKSRLKRNDAGLVPAVVQADSGEVLMLAWMDDHALAYTLATRRGTYYSRSRKEYWIKGATSGHVQQVSEVRLDCDGDTILMVVKQTGGACHTGDRTCFDADQLLAPPAHQGTSATGAASEGTSAVVAETAQDTALKVQED